MLGYCERRAGAVAREHVVRAALVGRLAVRHRADDRQLVGDLGGLRQRLAELARLRSWWRSSPCRPGTRWERTAWDRTSPGGRSRRAGRCGSPSRPWPRSPRSSSGRPAPRAAAGRPEVRPPSPIVPTVRNPRRLNRLWNDSLAIDTSPCSARCVAGRFETTRQSPGRQAIGRATCCRGSPLCLEIRSPRVVERKRPLQRGATASWQLREGGIRASCRRRAGRTAASGLSAKR